MININEIEGFMKDWLLWLMIFLSDLTGYPIERVNRVGILFFFGILVPIACFFIFWLVLEFPFIVSLLLAFPIYFAVVFLSILL